MISQNFVEFEEKKKLIRLVSIKKNGGDEYLDLIEQEFKLDCKGKRQGYQLKLSIANYIFRYGK